MSHLRWAEEALNCLSVGVLLLTSDATIEFANRAAEQLLQRGEGIRARGGRLVAVAHMERAQLAGVITQTARGETQALRVDRGTGRRPLHVLAAPLPPQLETGDEPATGESAIMAVVIDPEAATAPSSEMLQALYRFTNAEACLARRLAMGDRLEDYAQHKGISINTARTHLKAVFAKTDTDRQADLIRLLAWTLLDGGEESRGPHQNR
jgi:DNA-binding CsgD family transcriptional regulator